MPMLPDDHAMTAASLAGGAASSIVNRSPDKWYRKIAEGVCGATVGTFVGPSVADSIGAIGENNRVAVAFAVGAAGYGLVTAFVDYLKGSTIREWFGRFVEAKARPPG